MGLLPWFKRTPKAETRSFITVGGEPGGAKFRAPVIAPWNERAAVNNELVAVCNRWSLDNIVEPPIQCVKETEDGDQVVSAPEWERFADEPMGSISKNRGIDLRRVIQTWTYSLNLDGNAYGLILQNDSGGFVGIMPIIHTDVSVKTTPDGYGIEKYRIGSVDYDPERVVHIRRGVDHRSPAMGISPLKAAMRSIMADSEISAYQHRVVQSPTPGVIVTLPSDAEMTEEEYEQYKARAKSQFGAENQGGMVVLQGGVEMEKLGFSPMDLAIEKLARLPEERITAAFGIPAMVIGVGAGLDRSTYDNFRASMYAAAVNHLGPLWNIIESALTLQCSELFRLPEGAMLKFDLSRVQALQENTDAIYKRANDAFRANVIDRATAKQMIGHKALPDDVGVYSWMLSPQSLMMGFDGETPADQRLRGGVR